jgi:CheY-like chemotaxis protein
LAVDRNALCQEFEVSPVRILLVEDDPLLITDVKLPGSVDGWQIAERCREHDPELPVIYATGFSPVAPRPVSGSLALPKPYRPEDIVRAVRRVASNQA